MAGFPRSDLDADTWQTITPDDWSWLDHVKAAGSDTGNALSNLGQNLFEALSPFAPNAARAGQPSLQVPPMISGLADSYMRLAGTPSQPGNAYDLTGVRELDAPIQADMSNALLSLYGGQAVGALGKGKAATAALPMDEASRLARARELGFDVDNPVYHGSRNNPKPFKEFDLSKIGKGTDYGWFGEGVYTTPSEYRAGNYAGETGHVRSMYGRMENPFDWHAATAQGPDALRELGLDLRSVPQAEKGARITETLKGAGYDGVNIYYPGSRAADERLFFDANQLRDMNAAFDPARSGEAGLLLSDTGKPSLLGSALATVGESKSKPILSGGPLDFVQNDASYSGLLAHQAVDHIANLANIPGHYMDGRAMGASIPSAAADTINTLMASKNALNTEYALKRKALEEGGKTPFQYTIETPEGDFMGSANGTVVGDTMFLDWLGGRTPNSIGVSGVKALREQVRSDFPDVKKFQGTRISGARDKANARDRTQTVTLLSDNRPSLLGSALATAGELPMDHASRIARAEEWRAKNRNKFAPQYSVDGLERPEPSHMLRTARGMASGSLGLKPAVRIDGKSFAGENHAIAAENAGIPLDDASVLLYNGKIEDGYLTSSGQFVSREEAAKLLDRRGELTTKGLQFMEGYRREAISDPDKASIADKPYIVPRGR